MFAVSYIFLISTINLAFAENAIPHVPVDGTISEQGCKVIGGTIMSALDVQNTPIHVCEYHGKHFKLSAFLGCPLITVGDTQDPQTGQKFNFDSVCDEPTTCGLQNSWGGYNWGNVGNTDLLDASTINGTGYVITTKYDEGVCLSEKYDEQKKKITLIADGLWKNQTVLNVLVPKLLLINTTVTVDGKNEGAHIEEFNPKNETQSCNLCYYTINIPILSSPTSKKIEIGGPDNTVYSLGPDFGLPSPLKQFKSGVKPTDITCQVYLQLIFKTVDGSPACVTLQTAKKLDQRNWGTYVTVNSIKTRTTDNHTKNQISYENGMNGTISGVVSVYVYGGPTMSSPNHSAHYEVDVYANDGITIVGRSISDVDGHYLQQLTAGNYVIYTYNDTKQEGHHVTVYPGKNTVFNISYSMSVP
jgi:hypothetical protein